MPDSAIPCRFSAEASVSVSVASTARLTRPNRSSSYDAFSPSLKKPNCSGALGEGVTRDRTLLGLART